MSRRILVLGYGNPGRRDDGLGPALIAALERRGVAGVSLEADYQLNVEDAAAVAEHDVVIFVDAGVDSPAPFEFKRLQAAASTSFTSHHMLAQGVLALAYEVFHRAPEAYLMTVRGYVFDEFGEGLSPEAQRNFAAAAEFLARKVDELSDGR